MINWLILVLTVQGHSCLNGRGLTPLDSASFDKVGRGKQDLEIDYIKC